MSPTSRRIFLYWLLLLVPTLVVGGGAIYLLRREQARLTERGAYADEARKAAIAARARLIVENVELLLGEVEAGLLDTLASLPAEDLESDLARLEQTNPLVRTAFHAAATGRVLWPDPRTGNEEARGFLRRFAKEFAARPPWTEAAAEKLRAPEKREQLQSRDESAARKEVEANVAQVQSARRDVQELFKNQNLAGVGDTVAAAPSAPSVAMADSSSGRAGLARERNVETDRQAQTPAPAAASSPRSSPAANKAASRTARTVAQAPRQIAVAKDNVAERRGWMPTVIDGRLHVLGWIQPGGKGDVRGVELELAALISRLGGALPAEPGSGEGYALRDDRGRILHQAGAVPREGESLVRVPFAASLLPGWDVTAYLAPGPGSASNGAGFFWVSLLLVGIFVAAILAGGSLLLWQARRSESEAAQKTSFVANVSHEFKTPLTTIRLYSELLEQGRVKNQAQGAEYLRTIGRETQRLARLVNNALDFSRLEQGRKKYSREELDVSEELRRLLDTHEPRIAEAGLTLQRELPVESVRVKTDRDALEQIVLNVIDNACKYAAKGGGLSVSVSARPAGGAEIRVSDRGPGVPLAHQERIFEKFHRVDDALTAEKAGAGLGLSIARQLARGLGCELRYASREGGGAEFILELR